MAAPIEARVRAREIFHQSGNIASDKTIAGQLCREGLGIFTPQAIGTWRRRHAWTEGSPRAKQMTEMGEELRQAIQVRTPDDLDRVERASVTISAMGDAMARLGERLAEHVVAQIRKMHFETVADLETAIGCLETAARSTTDVLKSQLVVGRALQDLRLLRVSSAFGADQPRDGEIIPPDRREREPHPPLNAQEAVVSNFMDG